MFGPKPQKTYLQSTGMTTTRATPVGSPTQAAPKVDLFKQYGGYSGLLGVNPNMAPGTYTLDQFFGVPQKQPLNNGIQYSQQAAQQNLLNQIQGAIKNPTQQSPLSPQNTTRATKGPAKTLPELGPNFQSNIRM